MAKPGDVVEFRSGLHGLEAPRNLGVLLARERRKGVPWVSLVTLDGVKEIKAEHLTKRAFKQRVEDTRDKAAVADRLAFLVKQHVDGALAEEAEDDLGALEEALWHATCEGGVWTDEELARKHFGAPSPQQLRDVRAALERCRRPGVGRFETFEKGDRWRPWTRDEHDAMRAAWQGLEGLRTRLVEVEETEDGRAFHRVELGSAALTDADRATLHWVRDAMAQFVEHDGVPDKGPGGGDPFRNGVAGLGGTGATKVFGMDLHRSLGFLAQDWIRSGHTSKSSDYVHFLIESGLWTAEDAVAGLVKRHVNQEPFFEHVPDAHAEALANELAEPRFEDDPTRTDLRHLECFTIDPPDAKDFDDAVGTEDLGDRTRLWIHIADVSHYVQPGTALDRHARTRATSVYLPGRVLPMLPHRIADHLCSLRDDGDRFAMSVAVDVDGQGQIVGRQFCRSIIRVNENLSYGDALARKEDDPRFARLFELATRMRTHRRGLAIETGEVRVHLHAEGFQAITKHGDEATRMIEMFMVTANEAVASHLDSYDIPLLFRCHPLPDATRADRYRHQLETMGMELPFELPDAASGAADTGQSLLDALKSGGGKLELFGGGVGVQGAADEPEPEAGGGFLGLSEADRDAWLEPFRTAIDTLADHPDRGLAEVATLRLLSCMERAYYTPTNEGHFGLASTHYAHFTSPIRRYPDLVVHRNLARLIAGDEPEHDAAELETLCDHCSEQERAAAALERRVKSACLVLASLHGETAFSQSRARITGLTPASCFVLLDDGTEARVPARELPGGPFHVDEWESMLFMDPMEARHHVDLLEHYDEETGDTRMVRARLGDRITVRLAGRDVAEGKTGAELLAWAGQSAGAPSDPS